jgi:hypothetical protein
MDIMQNSCHFEGTISSDEQHHKGWKEKMIKIHGKNCAPDLAYSK